MAAAPRAITPTQTGQLPSTTVAPDTPTSISPNQPIARPAWQQPLSPSGNTGLRASLSPKDPTAGLTRLSPKPLTGAAALADERRLREQRAREQARQLSPNPAISAINALLGGANTGMSKARDAPATPTTMSEPLAKVAKAIQIPDNGTVDSSNMQTSPVSLSSFSSLDSTTAPTATAIDAPTAGSLIGGKAPMVRTPDQQSLPGGPLASAGEEIASSSSRAYTFPAPAPPDSGMRPPARNMSLPMSGYGQNSPKSPSAKRHKCPYCSTDFTRHHNLKSHLLTHSQEKPYECTTCQARFRRLHDLKRHTKLHTGERPHTCAKCGRRFARGDALARHTKGQGGCAGRRSSFEEMAEGKAGEVMEGIVYEGGEGEGDDDRMDDDEPQSAERRRGSDSAHRHHTRQASTSAPYQHRMPSTYPPLGGHLGGAGNKLLYPPGSSTGSSRDQSTLSPRTTGSTFSSIHFPGPPPPSSVFAQGGMTESPKPLSPGQPDSNQQRPGISETANHARGRSPSLAEQFQQQQFGRGTSRQNSSSLSHPPHLPSLPGLGAPERRSTGSGQMAPGGIQPGSGYQQVPPPPAMGSNTSSLSSQTQHTGSGTSIPGGRDADLWAHIQNLEAKLTQQSTEYNAKLSQLAEENNRLKERIGTLEKALLHNQQHPSPHLQQSR